MPSIIRTRYWRVHRRRPVWTKPTVFVSSSDSITIVETPSISAVLSQSDSTSVNDTGVLAASATSSDSSTAVEATPNISTPSTDSATITENNNNSVSSLDTGTLVETGSVLALIVSSDTIVIVDFGTLTSADITASDNLTLVETPNVGVGSTDTGTPTEGIPAVSISLTDLITGTETTSISALVNSTDVATLLENLANVAVSNSDSATAIDAVLVLAIGVFSSDSITLSEAAPVVFLAITPDTITTVEIDANEELNIDYESIVTGFRESTELIQFGGVAGSQLIVVGVLKLAEEVTLGRLDSESEYIVGRRDS